MEERETILASLNRVVSNPESVILLHALSRMFGKNLCFICGFNAKFV
jgi:hypothetical protein